MAALIEAPAAYRPLVETCTAELPRRVLTQTGYPIGCQGESK
jgi:hypothetical protein